MISKNKIEEFIRVDHAGERGAVKIYEGQLLALNTLVKDEKLKKTIEEMKVHEKEHCEFFENEIKKRNIKPTKLLPLWDLLGVTLGFGSTLLGKKATMLCTASVEEVIDKHYQNQIDQLDKSEKELKNKIIKFREDELHHKDIAYEKGATKKGCYSILDKVIKTGSKIAINISEKFNSFKTQVQHPNISSPSNFYEDS
jgi:ubiquinone biosynthesis monooxygenase Coq7